MNSTAFLAVDDDPAFLMVLRESMRVAGYDNLRTQHAPFTALVELQANPTPVEAILLDIEMPGMTGIELCRAIRTIPQHADTPIIMITSMTARAYVNDAFAAGATDYLTKPIELIDLKARLGMAVRLIEQRGTARRLEAERAAWSDLPGFNIRFSDPQPVTAMDRLIHLTALQNHVLTASRLRLHDQVAIGFRVVNAIDVYQCNDGLSYMDYLADTAAVIGDALKRTPYLMAHAGNGTFVCVAQRKGMPDPAELELEISLLMQQFSMIYDELGLPLPVVNVGQPQTASLLSPGAGKTLIDRALAGIGERGARARERSSAGGWG